MESYTEAGPKPGQEFRPLDVLRKVSVAQFLIVPRSETRQAFAQLNDAVVEDARMGRMTPPVFDDCECWVALARRHVFSLRSLKRVVFSHSHYKYAESSFTRRSCAQHVVVDCACFHALEHR